MTRLDANLKQSTSSSSQSGGRRPAVDAFNFIPSCPSELVLQFQLADIGCLKGSPLKVTSVRVRCWSGDCIIIMALGSKNKTGYYGGSDERTAHKDLKSMRQLAVGATMTSKFVYDVINSGFVHY
ncbi:unnamed protein product [Clavelina lepadiformis]|uniref:Uncharacterized protein n=1 Tax=Clavelina lepadiformis TaxID=159417 RepID=A0ABP0GH08_CLALP